MQMASAKESIPEKSITLTVAECGEFHNLGEYHENIASVEEQSLYGKAYRRSA